MAQRKRSRRELLGERYLKKTEHMLLFGHRSWQSASRAYAKADKYDDEKFGIERLEPHMVTIESALKANHMTMQTLIQLVKNASPEG